LALMAGQIAVPNHIRGVNWLRTRTVLEFLAQQDRGESASRPQGDAPAD
jgi:hypothetical protein